MSVCEILKIAITLLCVAIAVSIILSKLVKRRAEKRAAAEMARIRAQHEIFVRERKMNSLRAGMAPATKKSGARSSDSEAHSTPFEIDGGFPNDSFDEKQW